MSSHPNPAASQELPFDDLSGIEIRATRLDLVVEADPELDGAARLLAESGTGAPSLAMRGSRLIVSQEGRYRGMSAPVLRVPSSDLPTVAANINRGNLTLEGISASLAVNLDSGNLRISGGHGDIAANISSGDAVIRQREGDIACRASSGHVTVAGCKGDLALDTSKGNVDLQDCAGNVVLRVGKGDVTVLRPSEQALRVHGASGDVRVQGGSLVSAEIDIARGDITSTARLLFTAPAEPGGEPDIDLPDFNAALEEAVEEIEEEVRFNLGSVEFIASDAGVRVSTGGTERFIAGPEGVEFRRADGTPIFHASDAGVRVNATGSAGGREHFRFKTGRGNINLDVAEDQATRVELILNRGSVQSAIPLVEVGRPGPRSSTRRYVGVSDSSETDRILVRALTQRGDINVRMAKVTREPAPAGGLSNRDRQRRQILEALAQGRLTAAEADILLAAMERESG